MPAIAMTIGQSQSCVKQSSDFKRQNRECTGHVMMGRIKIWYLCVQLVQHIILNT